MSGRLQRQTEPNAGITNSVELEIVRTRLTRSNRWFASSTPRKPLRVNRNGTVAASTSSDEVVSNLRPASGLRNWATRNGDAIASNNTAAIPLNNSTATVAHTIIETLSS